MSTTAPKISPALAHEIKEGRQSIEVFYNSYVAAAKEAEKGNHAAAVRARKALQQLKDEAHIQRKHLTKVGKEN